MTITLIRAFNGWVRLYPRASSVLLGPLLELHECFSGFSEIMCCEWAFFCVSSCLRPGVPLEEALRHSVRSGVQLEFKPQLPTYQLCDLVRLLNLSVLHPPHLPDDL